MPDDFDRAALAAAITVLLTIAGLGLAFIGLWWWL